MKQAKTPGLGFDHDCQHALNHECVTERKPDTLPTPEDPVGPCPRCGLVSSFGAQYTIHLRSWNDPDARTYMESAFGMVCHGCSDTTIVVTSSIDDRTVELLHVYPAPGAGHLEADVSEAVASAYDEGVRCMSIGANR